MGSQLVRVLLNLTITAFMARLLLPADYGLVGMITVATGFLLILRDFGFGTALVQKKEVLNIEYDTVFWLNVFIGIFLGVLFYFSANLISDFYNEPKLILISKVLSVSFLINSLTVVPNNILLKNIKFKHLFVVEIFGLILSGSVGIIMALNDFSYWSIVGQTISLQLVTFILVSFYARWIPSLSFSKKALGELKSFSLPLIADSSLNYWVRNIDYLLIGKFLGKTSLGYYSKAYTLMLLPVRQISNTITKVMFPSFSLIQEDIERIKKIYFKISAVIAFISFPLMAILFFAASDLILFLFGDQWGASIPIFKVLCILGAFQSISTLSGNIYLALGKTKLMLQVGLVTKSLMILGISVGLWKHGLMGLVYGYTFTSLIGSLIEWYFVAKIIETSLKNFLLNIAPYLIFSINIIVFLYFIEFLFTSKIHLINLILISIIGSIVYLIQVLLIKPQAYKEIKLIIRERI